MPLLGFGVAFGVGKEMHGKPEQKPYVLRRHWNRHRHVIGGIACRLMHNLGYEVRGSDVADGPNVQALRDKGIDVKIGHDPDNVKGAEAVIVSTAISRRQSGSARRPRPAYSCCQTRGHAGGIDAVEMDRQRRRHPRQDDNDNHGCGAAR